MNKDRKVKSKWENTNQGQYPDPNLFRGSIPSLLVPSRRFSPDITAPHGSEPL